MVPENALDGAEFPFDLTFTVDSIKRAVEAALKRRVEQIRIESECGVTFYDEVSAAAILVSYLESGQRFLARFLIFITFGPEGVKFHFEAQDSDDQRITN